MKYSTCLQQSSAPTDSTTSPDKLRKGWTTGACATAAAKAAYHSLITGSKVAKVAITLPRGQLVEFELESLEIIDEITAKASVIKDAGDDPDVTHGAEVFSAVRLTQQAGVQFKAGEGVGTVTRPGLKLAVGEPAINPVPRQMLEQVIHELSKLYDQPGNVEITISIPNGEELAKRTLNGRLGIVGGLSILGTTGIVKPYSCSAWIDSIHRGIDVAKASNIGHVAACTGSTSEQAVQRYLGLADVAMLEMGDFVGAVLKYLRRHPIPRLTVGGGFGKICKLAMGHVNLHSKESKIDFGWLAEQAKLISADEALYKHIVGANTALEVLETSLKADLDLPTHIASVARKQINKRLDDRVNVSVIIVDRIGQVVGETVDG